jgi:hypothetical protein
MRQSGRRKSCVNVGGTAEVRIYIGPLSQQKSWNKGPFFIFLRFRACAQNIKIFKGVVNHEQQNSVPFLSF